MDVKVVSILLLTSLAACSDRDQAYYENNMDKAREKKSECAAAFMQALSKGNIEKARSSSQDKECKSAEGAIAEFQKIRQQLARKKSQENRKKADADYTKQLSKHKQAFEKTDLKTIYAFNQEICMKSESHDVTAKCKAAKESIRSKSMLEASILADKLSGDELIDKENKNCFGAEYNKLYCGIFGSAEAIKSSKQIEFYLNNRNEYKSTFNKCQAEWTRLEASSWKAASDYARSFECGAVLNAARTLDVHNFHKPID